MLNNLALEIPEKSKENARRRANASSQAKKRENETDKEKQARRNKEAKAQALKRSLETEEEREDRLQIDRDGHWFKRRADSKVVRNFAARVEKAKKDSMPTFAQPFVMPEYLNESEEKIVEDYLDRREADTKRRRSQKEAMSKEELDLFLDKNAKWHRDRRVAETKQRTAKWVDYYETMAEKADSNQLRLTWQAEAEKEKQKYQTLRAPDSRAAIEIFTSVATSNPSSQVYELKK